MSFVTLEHRGPVGLITMNRPEALNALNDQVLRELDAVLDQVEADDSILVAVITGAGRSFVAGADIGQMSTLTAAEAMGYRAVPETPILTRRKPLPGGGCLGLRLDWLLLRGMTPTKSRTLSTRTADCGFARPDSALARFAGEELSDHNAVWAACRMGVKDAK